MKETMKKFGAWLIAAALMALGIQTAVAADDEVSVKIGETVTQASFPNAFKGDTEGAEITFLKDVDTSTMGYTSSVGKTIDLNGYTFSTESTVPMGCFGGEWVFKDGKDGEGINLTKSSTKLIQVNDASVTVESGKYAVGADANSYLFSVTFPKKVNRTRDTELVITGGTFVGKLVTFDTGKLYTYGIYEPDEEEAYCNQAVRISGGTFSVEPNDAWIVSGYKTVQDTGTGYWSVVSDTPAVAKIGETSYETLAAALAAVKDGDTILLLESTSITSCEASNKTFTLEGADENAGIEITGGVTIAGCNVTFRNLTITKASTDPFKGFYHVNSEHYVGCKINGELWVYGNDASFMGCAFKQTANAYCPYIYGSESVTFDDCTFDVAGKAIKIAKDESSTVTVSVKNCDFNATEARKPAVMLDVSKSAINLIVDEQSCTLTGKYAPEDVEGRYPFCYSEYHIYDMSEDAYIAQQAELGVTVERKGQMAVGKDIVLDASGKVVGGTFSRITEGFISAGYDAVEKDGKFTIGVKTEDNTIITTKPQESKVEVPSEVVTDTEVAEKIQQSTKVEGVKLSATADEGKASGIVAVVEEAKKNTEFAAAVETAAEVSVKVEVAVEPTEYDNTADKGKVAFKLTPKATVTVVQDETKLEQVVEVTNDMIDQNQKIAVSIYTGFKPVAITHDDDNGARIEIFEGDQIAYNEVTGVATVLISHFSTLTGFGDAADVPPAKAPAVAKIGETGYETLAAAFEAAKSGETVVILNGEHDCTADAAFAKLGTKTVTLKGESQSGTILNMGNGNKTGVQTTPGTNLTLEDMTLRFDHSDHDGSPMYDHTFYHPESQTFRRVTIVGQIDIMDDTLFDTCTFTGKVNDKDEYLLWCYGCKAELVNCTFTGTGVKAPIKLFNEGAQCGLAVASTSFEALGSYGCAVYSSNKYPDNNVYEITVGENVTVPTETKLIRSSDTGLTVINPTKDENGKYTGGTFESEKKSGAEIIALTEKYAGEGFAPVVDPETGKVVVEEAAVAEVLASDGALVKKYPTLAKAVAAAEDGQTIKLLTNLGTGSETFYLGGCATTDNPSITLDLGGFTIFGKVEGGGCAANTKYTMTIKNGTLDGYGVSGCVALHPSGSAKDLKSKIILEDVALFGRIDVAFADVELKSGVYTISAEKAATVDDFYDAYGGVFAYAPWYGSSALVTGGKFDARYVEPREVWVPFENYLATGYELDGPDADGFYTVVSGGSSFTAEIVGGEKYKTVEAAFAAAKDGDTVKLLKDVGSITLEPAVAGRIWIDLGGRAVCSGIDDRIKVESDESVALMLVIKNGIIGTASGWSTVVQGSRISSIRLENVELYGSMIGSNGCKIEVFSGQYHANMLGNPVGDCLSQNDAFYGGVFDYNPDDVYAAQYCNCVVAPGYESVAIAGGKYEVRESALQPLVVGDDGFYHIGTVTDLRAFRSMVNGGNNFKGKTVVLDADLDLSDIPDWAPIGIAGNLSCTFAGTFDGQEKKIKNLDSGYGLFRSLGQGNESAATIKNLTIQNVTISGNNMPVGAICAGGNLAYGSAATFDNCHVIGNISIAGAWYVGGICGSGGNTFRNCSVEGNEGSTINGDTYVGGIYGWSAEGSYSTTQCSVSGVSINGVQSVGGIAGMIMGANSITECSVEEVVISASNDEGAETTGLIAGNNLGTSKYASYAYNNAVSETTATATYGETTYPTTHLTGLTTDGLGSVVGTDVTFDEDGKIVSGSFEQLVESKVADDSTVTKNDDGTWTVVAKSVAEIFVGDESKGKYATLAEAFAAAAEQTGTAEKPVVIQLAAGTIEEGTVKLPTTLKNVKMLGAENKATTIKNTRIMAHDGGPWDYQDLTFEGVVYDNSQFVFTGWRAGDTCTAKNWAFIGNEFKAIVNNPASNIAALHLNFSEGEPLVNLTFTGNVINGVTGSDCSGLYGTVSGKVLIKDCVINNVGFRPYCLQIQNNDGIDDILTVESCTFSGSEKGRAQANGVDNAGTDNVTLKINNCVFREIDPAKAQQICYWNFNEEKTANDFSKNYYDIDTVANYSRFYYNHGATSAADAASFGIYPCYTRLNDDGSIDLTSEFTYQSPVAKIVETGVTYPTLQAAVAEVKSGETIVLLADIELDEGLLVTAAKGALTIDLNGKTLTGADETYAIRVTNAGRLTVKNGTIQLGIGLDNWAWGIDNRGGTLDVVGVTFKGAGADYYGDFVTANWDWDYVVQEYNSDWDEWQTVALKDGAQFGVTTLKDCTIGFYGPEYECFSYQEFDGQCTKLIIEGGSYECMLGSNMFQPLELCGLEIRGGTFKRNDEHYYEPVGYANITGGEIHCTDDEVFSDCYVTGGSVFLDDGKINLAGIAGGTFVGSGEIEMEAARTITGGTFSREIWEAKSIASRSKGYEEMPALGYYYVENTDGSCTVQQVGTVKVSIQSTNTGCGTIGISAYTIGKTTWKKTTYGNPKTSVSDVEATKGGTITFTATATPKENYRFKGWFDNAAGSGQAISIEATLENFMYVVQNDVTIYAVFELNSAYAERVAAAKAWYDAGVAGGGLTISSTDEWKLFSDAVNLNAGSFAGKVVTLAADLDFTGLEYEPVGSQAFAFNGTFDGGEHTIRGVQIEAAKQAGYVGIFGNATGTIKNLDATDCSVTGGYCAGIIVGEGRTVINCHVTESEIGQDCYFGGGVIGHSYLMNLDNVSFENGTVTNGFKVGAIAGYGDYVTLKNATVQGNELSKGVAGLIQHANAEYATFTNVKVDQRDNPLIGTTYGVPVVINLGADSTAETEVWASKIVGLQGETGVTFNINSGIYNLASEAAVDEAKTLVPSATLLDEGVVVIRLIPTEIHVAKIVETGKGYPTLQAAVEDATAGQTVKLLANVEECIVVAADKDITLDLNGKMIDAKNVPQGSALKNLGKVTVTDSSEEKTGILARKDLGGNNVWYVINNEGDMVIDYANVTNICDKSAGPEHASLIRNNGGKMTINGGFFQQPYAVVKNEPESDLAINGGTFSLAGMNQNDIEIQCYGNVAINGGTFDAQVKHEEGATLVVSGGVFVNDLSNYLAPDHVEIVNIGEGLTTYTVTATVPENPSAWMIGTFTGPRYWVGGVAAANEAVLWWKADDNGQSEVLHLAVTPTVPKSIMTTSRYHVVYENDVAVGSCVKVTKPYELKSSYDDSTKVYSYWSEVIVEDAYACVIKPNGETVYYATLKSASTSAESGDVVKALKDDLNSTSASCFNANANTPLVFDMNGKTVGSAQKTITINRAIELTIEDSDGAGRIKTAVCAQEEGATIVIKGGVYEGQVYGKGGPNGYYKGTVIVQGGTFYNNPEVYVDQENYKVVDNGDGTWTVQSAYVAEIFVGDESKGKYATLAEAFAAVNDQDVETEDEDEEATVVLKILCDVTEELTQDYDFDHDLLIDTDVEGGVTVDFVNCNNERALTFDNWWGHMTITENVTMKHVAQLFAGDTYGLMTIDLFGSMEAMQIWPYKGTINIHPSARVVMGYGDGMIKMRNGSTLNVEGSLAAGEALTADLATTPQQLTGGYVSADYNSTKKLSLKNTYMKTGWVKNDSGYKFSAFLDNSIFEVSGNFDPGSNLAYDQAKLVNGSRMIVGGKMTTLHSTIQCGSILLVKELANSGTIYVDMTGATAESYKVIDYTGAGTMTLADYGTVELQGEGYVLKVIDNDLYVTLPPSEEIDVPVADSGEAVIPVKVPAEVFEQKEGQEIKGSDGQPLPAPTTTEEKQKFLAAEQPNGLKVWQNVAMGVDGNTAVNALATISREPTAAEVEKAKEAGKTIDIVINTPISEFDPPETTGVTVSYKLLRSTDGGVIWTALKDELGRDLELEKPEFPTYTKDDALISEGDTFWKFQAVFTSQANEQAE